jgi:hypothetical protein
MRNPLPRRNGQMERVTKTRATQKNRARNRVIVPVTVPVDTVMGQRVSG